MCLQEFYEYKTTIQVAESFTERGKMDISFCLTAPKSQSKRGSSRALNESFLEENVSIIQLSHETG